MKNKENPFRIQRRIVAAALSALTALVVALAWFGSPGGDTVVVYKRTTCECCMRWVEHLKQAGFEVIVHNESNLSARQDRHKVPRQLRACHTAMVWDPLESTCRHASLSIL